MELIWVALAAIIGVIGAACSRLLADEASAWLPLLTERLIRRAVARLPENDRPRREEEWRSHVNDTPGDMSKLLTAVGFCRASRSLCNEQTRRASISRGLTLCAVTAVACFPSVGGMLFGVVGASVGATVMLMAMAVLTYKFKALAKMVSFVARGIDAIFQIILGDRPDRRAVALAREIGALLVAAIAICLLPLMGSLLLGKFGGIAATSGMLILLQALEASNLYQDSRELLFAGRITRPPHRIIKLLGWVKRRRD